MESGKESLDALEEVFERIRTATGEDNLDRLVTRFIQGESTYTVRSLHMFLYTNTQVLTAVF